MTTNTRSDRKRWLWFTALLICIPALMGFYSWSCLTPVYGIFRGDVTQKNRGAKPS